MKLTATTGHIFTEPATPYSFLHDEYPVTSATYNLYSVSPFEYQVYFYLPILITIEVVNMPNQALLLRHLLEASGQLHCAAVLPLVSIQQKAWWAPELV